MSRPSVPTQNFCRISILALFFGILLGSPTIWHVEEHDLSLDSEHRADDPLPSASLFSQGCSPCSSWLLLSQQHSLGLQLTQHVAVVTQSAGTESGNLRAHFVMKAKTGPFSLSLRMGLLKAMEDENAEVGKSFCGCPGSPQPCLK